MLMTDQILVLPKFVSDSDCDELMAEFERKKILSYNENAYSVTENKNKQVTGRFVSVEPNNSFYSIVVNYYQRGLQEFVKFLDEKNSFNVEEYKNQLKYPHKIRIIKYSVGQSIHPHTDWEPFTHASITLNLNEDYEGGEFAFFNKKHKIKLQKGDVLVFPADTFYVHEVLPITKGARYSINSFIRSVPYDERTLIYKQIFELQNKIKPIFHL